MKRLMKWAGALLGLLLIALVSAVVVVTTVIDPNQFKPLIISQFSKFTGFQIAIPGNLSWSFYPHLGLEAGEVTINNPTVFSSKLKKVVLRARFAPLLHKQLDFSKVSIGELQVNNLVLTQVDAKIKFMNQVLALEHITADLYQGNLSSDVQISLKQVAPELHVVGKLKKVDLAELLKGLSGKTTKLQFDGLVDANLDVVTRGKKSAELIKQLNGSAHFTVGKGVLKGIDLAYYVNTAAALVNKDPLPAVPPIAQTEFGEISGTAVIKNGVIRMDKLALDSSSYTAKAAGYLDLTNQTLDYHVDVSPTFNAKTNKTLVLYGKVVPVRVSGNMSDPSITLDTLALMKEIGKEQLQRVGEEIQKALPNKANNLIKKFFR